MVKLFACNGGLLKQRAKGKEQRAKSKEHGARHLGSLGLHRESLERRRGPKPESECLSPE
jgi:hypothetical protein